MRREYAEEENKIKEAIERNNDLEAKYRKMLVQVEGWQLPTPGHQNFKEFMVDQIKESIEFDCGVDFWIERIGKLTLLTGQQWLEKRKSRLLEDLDHHLKKDTEEKERAADRNEWIRQLRESL